MPPITIKLLWRILIPTLANCKFSRALSELFVVNLLLTAPMTAPIECQSCNIKCKSYFVCSCDLLTLDRTNIQSYSNDAHIVHNDHKMLEEKQIDTPKAGPWYRILFFEFDERISSELVLIRGSPRDFYSFWSSSSFPLPTIFAE